MHACNCSTGVVSQTRYGLRVAGIELVATCRVRAWAKTADLQGDCRPDKATGVWAGWVCSGTPGLARRSLARNRRPQLAPSLDLTCMRTCRIPAGRPEVAVYDQPWLCAHTRQAHGESRNFRGSEVLLCYNSCVNVYSTTANIPEVLEYGLLNCATSPTCST